MTLLYLWMILVLLLPTVYAAFTRLQRAVSVAPSVRVTLFLVFLAKLLLLVWTALLLMTWYEALPRLVFTS